VAINPNISPTDIDSLRRYGVEPILVADVGHFPMLEAPDRFIGAEIRVPESREGSHACRGPIERLGVAQLHG
jgi:hypothetical protein